MDYKYLDFFFLINLNFLKILSATHVRYNFVFDLLISKYEICYISNLETTGTENCVLCTIGENRAHSRVARDLCTSIRGSITELTSD